MTSIPQFAMMMRFSKTKRRDFLVGIQLLKNGNVISIRFVFFLLDIWLTVRCLVTSTAQFGIMMRFSKTKKIDFLFAISKKMKRYIDYNLFFFTRYLPQRPPSSAPVPKIIFANLIFLIFLKKNFALFQFDLKIRFYRLITAIFYT